MEQVNHTLLRHLKSKRNQPLLLQCAQTIEEMQEQLQKTLKINEEQRKLIDILKQGKEYYENQYKNNAYATQYVKLQQQNQRLNALIEGHRQVIQQLKRNVEHLNHEISLQRAKTQQQEKALREQQEKYLSVTLQKQILQKEWNKVVKAVKRKIAKIVQQAPVNQQYSEARAGYKSLKKTAQKQNSDPDYQVKYISKRKFNPEDELNLQDRAKKMIRMINDKLAIQQLQDLFHTETSSKKEASPYPQNGGPGTRTVLRQLDMNQFNCPFKVEFD